MKGIRILGAQGSRAEKSNTTCIQVSKKTLMDIEGWVFTFNYWFFYLFYQSWLFDDSFMTAYFC